MKIKRFLLLLSLVAFLFTSFIGCASRAVYVRTAPPAKRVEVRSARPFANAVWIAGYWRWNGNKYVWAKGKWAKPKKGKKWIPGHWKSSRRGYFWVPGHWK